MNQLQIKPNDQKSHGGHAGHGWMMLACCVPMVVIAVVLIATGVATAGFLVGALMCGLMMVMMMRMMSGGHQ